VELGAKIAYLANALGTSQAPFDAWLVLRGLETLAIRMQKHEQNALQIAQFLEQHPHVEKVYYPGLESHASHHLAKRYLRGFGGMVSFEIAGGIEAARQFFRRVQWFGFAESLGGIASLCQHPATMSHAAMPEDHRKALGIRDNLIRLSIGLEHIQDLIDGLEKGLA
jgi:cystathionine beta-lyase/cystathionine gamma-synthase